MLKDEKAMISNETITTELQDLRDYFKKIWKETPEDVAKEEGKGTAYNRQIVLEHIFPWFSLGVLVLTLIWEATGLQNKIFAILSLASLIALIIYSSYMSSYRKRVFSNNMEDKKSRSILMRLDRYFDRPDEAFADGDEKLRVMTVSLEDENSIKNRTHDTVSSIISTGVAVAVGFIQVILEVLNVKPFDGPEYAGLIFTLIMMCPLLVYLVMDVFSLIKGDFLDGVLLDNLKMLEVNRCNFASDDLEYLKKYYDREIMNNADLGTEERILKNEQYAVRLMNVGRRFFNEGDFSTAVKYFQSGLQAITILESCLCDDHTVDIREISQLRELLSEKNAEAEKLNVG